jgi:uncharacterized membrane protein
MINRWIIFRLVSLAALALCSASLSDTVLFGPTYCGFQSDCGQVSASAFSRPLAVPMPILGIVGFGALFCVSLCADRRGVILSRLFAVAAGAIGGGLIVVQLVALERLCPLCILVDSCGIALAILSFSLRPIPRPVDRTWLRLLAWVGASGLVTVAPIAWAGITAPPPPPPQVQSYWEPGKINIVELTDFDCSSCAEFEPIMREAMRDAPNCHFVRIAAPMPKHENARPAARAYFAASKQGKGESMAALLFAAKSRTPENCRKFAMSLDLDMAEYDRVVVEPATDAEFDATLAWAQQAGPGLPMVWIQERFFPPRPTLETLARAINQVAPFSPK